MSSGIKCLEPTKADIQNMLACNVHIGTKNVTPDMRRYVHSSRKDGVHIFDLKMTWEKLILAARIMVTIENPADVCTISARPFGQRAVLKFAQYSHCQYIASRFTPGTFTNQIQEKFMQPRLLLVTDPRTDHQAVLESSYVNIPVIAFCDTDSLLEHVDVAIPCNNRGKESLALMYWMLAREILRMRNELVRTLPWEVKMDLFLYRDPEELQKHEADHTITHQADFNKENQLDTGAAANWGDETAGNWGESNQQKWDSEWTQTL